MSVLIAGVDAAELAYSAPILFVQDGCRYGYVSRCTHRRTNRSQAVCRISVTFTMRRALPLLQGSLARRNQCPSPPGISNASTCSQLSPFNFSHRNQRPLRSVVIVVSRKPNMLDWDTEFIGQLLSHLVDCLLLRAGRLNLAIELPSLI